jgi:hypothetical protein
LNSADVVDEVIYFSCFLVWPGFHLEVRNLKSVQHNRVYIMRNSRNNFCILL